MPVRKQHEHGIPQPSGAPEAGFMLAAVTVMVALVLITLAVAAPVIARDLRRDKEIESQHRAQQYVRAIQLYQRKFQNQYPPSVKALEGSNNIRFLRQQYVDPLTGKADWRLIIQGQQKTKIKVFFGQELGGLTAGLGSVAGMASGAGTSPTSTTSTIGATNPLASGFTGASSTTTTGGTTGSPASTDSSPLGGDSSVGPIVGVGTSRTGDSVTAPNGQTTYQTWEFWYDPRIELLKKNVSLTGGGVSSTSASSFGSDAASGKSNSGTSGTTTGGSNSGNSGTTGTTSPQ